MIITWNKYDVVYSDEAHFIRLKIYVYQWLDKKSMLNLTRQLDMKKDTRDQ